MAKVDEKEQNKFEEDLSFQRVEKGCWKTFLFPPIHIGPSDKCCHAIGKRINTHNKWKKGNKIDVWSVSLVFGNIGLEIKAMAKGV